MKIKTPTLRQKVEQYESLLELLSLCMNVGTQTNIQKLLSNIDDWSYSHRKGNGELSEKEQQKLINKAFWKLNDLK
jgi:hypothetical protein